MSVQACVIPIVLILAWILITILTTSMLFVHHECDKGRAGPIFMLLAHQLSSMKTRVYPNGANLGCAFESSSIAATPL